MITFKAVIIPSGKRKDGTWPVKIRVTYKGVSRRLPTTLVCRQSDLTRSMKIKSGDILNRSDELIGRMRACVTGLTMFDLDGKDVDWVVSYITGKMRSESFRLDFFEWADVFLQSKQLPTRGNYIVALNAFARYLGRRSVDINDISRRMVVGFVDMVDGERKRTYNRVLKRSVESRCEKSNKTTASRYVIMLQHIFNEAKKRYNDEDGSIVIPKSPFSGQAKPLVSSGGQKSLGIELMQRIISDRTQDRNIRMALDAFVVSFGLMGANLADLYNARMFDGETWIYQRQKTKDRRQDNAEMRVTVPAVLKPYIDRLHSAGSAWWLTAIHDRTPVQAYASCKVNAQLKRWCEANGIPRFTFYAARHSWATIARSIGIEKATIDECLCHRGDFDMADIYAERSWTVINDANRKVLELFDFTVFR